MITVCTNTTRQILVILQVYNYVRTITVCTNTTMQMLVQLYNYVRTITVCTTTTRQMKHRRPDNDVVHAETKIVSATTTSFAEYRCIICRSAMFHLPAGDAG